MPKSSNQYAVAAKDFWKRFDSRVHKSGECLVWTGKTDPDGYGILLKRGKYLKAHRVSWERSNGKIRGKLSVLHRCDNPSCVDPRHLFLGTRADNVADCLAKGRIARGERHSQAKLTNRQVLRMRTMYKNGSTRRSLSRIFRISQTNTCIIVSGKGWKHGPFPAGSNCK